MLRTTLAAAAASLLLAAPAAARPPLTQYRADAAAAQGVEGWVDYYAALHDPALPEGDQEVYAGVPGEGGYYTVWNVTVERSELDPCDVDRRGAECDATLYFSDGDACDVTFVMKLTRRGHLNSWDEDLVCDSGKTGATQ